MKPDLNITKYPYQNMRRSYSVFARILQPVKLFSSKNLT